MVFVEMVWFDLIEFRHREDAFLLRSWCLKK
jgi:hypothetical protein